MSGEVIITARWRCPLSRLFAFRDRISGYEEHMSATQEGSDAIIEVEISRENARSLELPKWAERLD